MDNKTKYIILEDRDGDNIIDGQVSEADYQKAKGLISKPEPVLAGKPRRSLGEYAGRQTLLGLFGKDSFVIDLLGDSPDAFAIRGFNLPYTPLPGIVRPTGIFTEWGGLVEPIGFVKPEGYRIRYFKDAKTQADRYYEQSSLPDEVFAASDDSKKKDEKPTLYELQERYRGTPNNAQ